LVFNRDCGLKESPKNPRFGALYEAGVKQELTSLVLVQGGRVIRRTESDSCLQ
jgi:hypothetical protein